MTKNRQHLPHQVSDLFLTDGGLETTMVFLEGFELPCFAAFDLLKDEKGYQALRDYYKRYLAIAVKLNTGFILESPTWRANPDWLTAIGYPDSAVSAINIKAVQLLSDLRKEFQNSISNILISGCIGPRGDGYKPGNMMTAEEASLYHAVQIEILSTLSIDFITALTMNYAEEAIGITRAAASYHLPAVISFTVETDGKLPDGMRLKDAIALVDSHCTQPPIYYMINCAHPTHFMQEMLRGTVEKWTSRIRGIRANASCKSHSELDEATELDRGNPKELGHEYQQLKSLFKQLNVFGGCCGTDEEHVMAIAENVSTS
jgi:S-methylmethionine-dependent homocysteine/selenocysteine methylase